MTIPMGEKFRWICSPAAPHFDDNAKPSACFHVGPSPHGHRFLGVIELFQREGDPVRFVALCAVHPHVAGRRDEWIEGDVTTADEAFKQMFGFAGCWLPFGASL